jgi:hypothetical protein
LHLTSQGGDEQERAAAHAARVATAGSKTVQGAEWKLLWPTKLLRVVIMSTSKKDEIWPISAQ